MIFRFDDYELDTGLGELRRGGRPVEIQPKPLALLELLLRERHRVVSHQELLETLWPDAAVTPGSLSRAVSLARRAIGDDHRGERLRSVPRRGYRLCGEVLVLDERAAEAAAATPAAQAPFVGRESALAALRAAWHEARAGHGGLVLLAGPPGVGKTRLGAVFAEEAEREGARVLAGASHEGGGAPPFWLWTQVLRRLLAADPEPELIAELAAAGAELPGLAPALPDGSAAASVPHAGHAALGPEHSRFLLFDAVARALCRASRTRPLLLLLDDLQWADAPSLRLLEHLGHELLDAAILIVAGVRDEPRAADHPLQRALPALRRHTRCTEVALRGCAQRDVARWLEQLLGHAPPPELTSALYARTDGIPLFVREAIRQLAERGELRQPERIRHWSVTIPGYALELIRRPLEALAPEAAALMAACAVIGREFTLPQAAAVAGLAREAALERLDEARRAGVVEEAADPPGHWRFVHALFRESALATASAGARAQLHARAADELERRHAGALDAVIAEIAHHRHAALAAGGAEQAWAAATRAAEHATSQLAWEQAALHHEQAVDALDAADVPDPERRLTTLLALGEALRRAGDRERRLHAFARALAGARELRRPRELALAAIGTCDIAEWAAAETDARAALEEALAALGEEPSVESARARARLAFLTVRGATARAEEQARRAVAEARAAGDPTALQEALYVLHFTIGAPERLEERAALSDELVAAAERSPAREAAVIALADLASDRLALGDAAGSARARARAGEMAGPRPHPATAWHLLAFDAGRALLEGRVRAAEAGIGAALATGRRAGHPYAEGVHGVQRAELARLRGDAETVLRIASEDPWSVARPIWLEAMAARALLALGREAEARTRFEGLAQRGFARMRRNVRWTKNMVELAGLCAELRDGERAAELFALLAPFDHHHSVLPIPVCYGGPASHALGLLCQVSGDFDDADEWLARADADARRLGAVPSRIRIAIDHGRLRAARGDRRGARSLLEGALARAQAAGLAHLAQAAREAGARIG